MGYYLHIVRRDDYEDLETDSNISFEEWLAVVASDPELELTNGYKIKFPHSPGSTFQSMPGFSVWNAHPTLQGKEQPWFDYGHGYISTKYPDDDTVRKMIKIAAQLNAKVQSDHEEFYDESYFIKKENRVTSEKNKMKKAWWKFW